MISILRENDKFSVSHTGTCVERPFSLQLGGDTVKLTEKEMEKLMTFTGYTFQDYYLTVGEKNAENKRT